MKLHKEITTINSIFLCSFKPPIPTIRSSINTTILSSCWTSSKSEKNILRCLFLQHTWNNFTNKSCFIHFLVILDCFLKVWNAVVLTHEPLKNRPRTDGSNPPQTPLLYGYYSDYVMPNSRLIALTIDCSIIIRPFSLTLSVEWLLLA